MCRWAGPEDTSGLARLLTEIKLHYRLQPNAPGEQERAAAEWLQPKPGHGRFVLALAGKDAIGFTFVAVVRPATGLSGALHMKELFVSRHHRGRGAGRQLLMFLAGYCRAEGLERIDFTTENWNEDAIRFYEREGAAIQKQKIALRLDAASLKKLAAGGDE